MKQIKKEIYIALSILNDKNYDAYIVGGAVRNLLLGSKIVDYDITTNASPDVVKQLFAEYPLYTIGEKHGTVVVTINKVKIDITTFRSDFDYVDHRRPNSVTFSDDLNEDLKRRDFTINALCLDKNDKIIDNFNGVEDLNKKIIRAIGEPKARFHEDALRILRALRFSSRFNFKIEAKTKEAMFECKDLLNYISNERKKEELLYILGTNNRLKTINEYLDIFNTFIPFKKTTNKLDTFSNEYFALAYLLSKTEGYDLKKLTFSKQEINLIEALVEATNTNLKKDYDFISLLCDPLAKEILKYISELYSEDFKDRYKRLKKYMVNKENLKINGNDLIELGYKGKNIGVIQDELVELIRHQLLTNSKTALLKYLKLK